MATIAEIKNQAQVSREACIAAGRPRVTLRLSRFSNRKLVADYTLIQNIYSLVKSKGTKAWLVFYVGGEGESKSAFCAGGFFFFFFSFPFSSKKFYVGGEGENKCIFGLRFVSPMSTVTGYRRQKGTF